METPDKTLNNAKMGGRKIAPLAVYIGIIIVAVLCLTPLFTRLTVREYKSDKLLLALPIEDNERFSIRFTHSVNLSYVTDGVEWTGNELILRDTLFTSFGAGIPVIAEGIGTEIENTEDGFIISGIDAVQENAEIPVMLQEVPDHHLLYRDEEISLRDLSRDVAFIKIRVERISLVSMLVSGQAHR